MSLHPIHTTEYLRSTYERYLKTIYPFQDELLREGLWNRLSEPDRLVKGPILEASPPYKTGRSIAELVESSDLHPSFEALCGSTANLENKPLPYYRPLYLHQERAIINIVRNGRNAVVATGTGSGKTESFLIPILNYLMREEELGTLQYPGVRALLLYPMNALANDQLMRLRNLLQAYPSITFGRYTGETLENKTQAEERFLSGPNSGSLLPNELLSREEMRESPPHILLTNYAMLEYLLLRPQDTELFDGQTGKHWRFVVVDEAHVYDGAIGMEIAMLLRRVKDRTLSSEPGRLTCIATSATLGKGIDDFPKVADFAQGLFGEPFTAEDVVPAEKQPLEALGDTWGEGSPLMYHSLEKQPTATTDEIATISGQYGVPEPILEEIRQAANVESALYALLRGDRRLRTLQTILRREPTIINLAADELFPELNQTDAQGAIIQLVDLAVRARSDSDSLPLLPARYHVFARALEGAFVCFNADSHPDGRPLLLLNRHENCPICHAQIFELATCVRCGVTYIVGEKVFVGNENGQRRYAVRALKGDLASGQGGQRVYYVVASDLPEPNEDETASIAQDEDDDWLLQKLCLFCGGVSASDQEPCQCGGPKRLVRLAPFDGRDEEKMYCSACSTRSRGTVYRLLTGKDAPVSVLTSGLYTELPPATDDYMQDLPGQGRKLLLFADSRQDAAFFAPYMERNFNNILQRRLIYKTLQEEDVAADGQLRLTSVARLLLNQAENAGIFELRQDYLERLNQVQTWLIREMMSWGFEQSLERQGLLYFPLVQPPSWQPPLALQQPPWNLSREESWDLICMLLDTVRRTGALVFPDGIDPRDEFFYPLNRSYYISDYSLSDPQQRKRHAVLGWVPRRGSNSRLDLLDRILCKIDPTLADDKRQKYAKDALTGLWNRHLAGSDSVWSEYLQTKSLGQAGVAYQLDHAFWQWHPSNETTPLWRCNHCQNIAYRSLHRVCSTYGCEGELEPIQFVHLTGANNHYRHLYHNLHPAALSIQEHTAQWRPEKAREIQEEFINGKVNMLSCSTTFELGVDVGALQAVLMRNVPPTTANYLQRAGRAGRRANTAAFVLTYAQRRSHDLAYYRQPEKMLSGAVPTPTISIRNAKIVQRHMSSVLIAAFLRWCADNLGRFRSRKELRVGEFFVPDSGQQSGPELLREYLDDPPDEVLQALLRIVPDELQDELQVKDWTWLDQLSNENSTGIFDLVAAQVEEDVSLYNDLASEAMQEGNERAAWRAASYFRVLKTIKGRDLINYFGQRGVLPKYGFPVDVVPLRTDHIPDSVAADVELDRDLRMAISEFAPGSQLVAGKKIFTGGGLYKQPNKDWETIEFAICSECGRFNKQKGNTPLNLCSSCANPLPLNAPGKGGTMVKPEFGFVARRDVKLPTPSETRPPRTYSSRVYFDDYRVPEHLQDMVESDHAPQHEIVNSLSRPGLEVRSRYSRFGQLAVVNHGQGARGFRVCLVCGHAEAAPPPAPPGRRRRSGDRPHKNPRTGRDCSGFTKIYRLGHEFITDVLELQIEGSVLDQLAMPPGKDAWLSFLYALIEGASAALGIRRSDLNGTLYPYRHAFPPALVLYDDVPGGAGHVRRIKDALPEVLIAARDRLEKCECGIETACHECLWNYYNQPFHDELSRGVALDFIDLILTE